MAEKNRPQERCPAERLEAGRNRKLRLIDGAYLRKTGTGKETDRTRDSQPEPPKRLTQGWTFWGITTASTGFPFTVVTPYGSAEFGIDNYSGGTVRTELVSTPTYKHGNQGPEEQLFSNAGLADSSGLASAANSIGSTNPNPIFTGHYFSVPLTVVNGNTVAVHPGDLGRNTFRTAGWSNLDLSLAKDTHIAERASLQFRAEFFNILNQHAFAIPNRTLGTNGFGFASSTLFDPREIQLGLRLIF